MWRKWFTWHVTSLIDSCASRTDYWFWLRIDWPSNSCDLTGSDSCDVTDWLAVTRMAWLTGNVTDKIGNVMLVTDWQIHATDWLVWDDSRWRMRCDWLTYLTDWRLWRDWLTVLLTQMGRLRLTLTDRLTTDCLTYTEGALAMDCLPSSISFFTRSSSPSICDLVRVLALVGESMPGLSSSRRCLSSSSVISVPETPKYVLISIETID